jgi:hypothetical protein
VFFAWPSVRLAILGHVLGNHSKPIVINTECLPKEQGNAVGHASAKARRRDWAWTKRTRIRSKPERNLRHEHRGKAEPWLSGSLGFGHALALAYMAYKGTARLHAMHLLGLDNAG